MMKNDIRHTSNVKKKESEEERTLIASMVA